MNPVNNIAEALTNKVMTSPVQLAAVPTLSGFLQKDSVKVGLGWASIGIAVVMLGCIFLGIYKVAPVATSFWKRRNGMDEGAENAKNFAIGWAMLIIVPIVISSVVGMVFGKDVVDAITAALKTVFQ